MRLAKLKYRPLPLGELAICKRVREERRGTLLNQSQFASSIGLTRDQLASIESGRVPLRADAGLGLCLQLDVNPLWLAYGDEYEQPHWIGFSGFGALPQSPPLFSELIAANKQSYATVRDAAFARRQPRIFTGDRQFRGLTAEQKAILLLLEQWGIRILPSDYWALARHMRRAADNFDLVKGALTSAAQERILSHMTPRTISYWGDLRRRLISATNTLGAQAELARYLKVTRQAVSEWLRRSDRAPSAEKTLRLLEWVTAEEAKQQKKRAGSASTRPALKTRKDKSTTNEKDKSDQKKS